MKTFIYLILCTLCVVVFNSCSTSQKITVNGQIGTEIYNPQKQLIAQIPQNGEVKIKISNKKYVPFLLSKTPNDSVMVPFALNYKYKNHSQKSFLIGSGITLAATLPFGIAYGEVVFSLFGSGLMGYFAWSTKELTGGDPLNHNYAYLPNHSTNQDIKLTNANIEYATTLRRSSSAQSGKETTMSASLATRTIASQTANRKINTNATAIEGSYVGSGSLKKGSEVIESYSNITITLTPVDSKTVTVYVEEGGTGFFNQPDNYSVKKNSKGDYTLTNQDVKQATITVSPTHNMIYLHPRVNIDGEIYTLEIKAKLKK